MAEFSKPFYEKIFIEDAQFFKTEQKFDLILSSMCLQWFLDIENSIKTISSNTKGNFYFAIPKEESLQEINECFKKFDLKSPVLKFKIPKKCKQIAEKCYKEEFSSLINALKNFNLIGAKNEYILPPHSLIKKMENLFNKQITWNIGFFIFCSH